MSVRGSVRMLDLARLEALGTVDDFELNPRTLFEGPETFGLDGGMMDENVRSVILLDETKALGIVKPLHRTFFHFHYSFASVRYGTIRQKDPRSMSTLGQQPGFESLKKKPHNHDCPIARITL